MLDHLSHSLFTLPLHATVGFREQAVRPLAVDDVVDVMVAALIDGRLAGKTLSVLGPETLFLSDAVRRVAQVLGRRVLILPAPVAFHYAMVMMSDWSRCGSEVRSALSVSGVPLTCRVTR